MGIFGQFNLIINEIGDKLKELSVGYNNVTDK